VGGLHHQGAAKDEGDALPSTEVGQPVPGDDALDGKDQALPVGLDGLEEGIGGGWEVPVDQGLPPGRRGCRPTWSSRACRSRTSGGAGRCRIASVSLLRGYAFLVTRPADSGRGGRRRGPR
jgi:hypothetical protein